MQPVRAACWRPAYPVITKRAPRFVWAIPERSSVLIRRAARGAPHIAAAGVRFVVPDCLVEFGQVIRVCGSDPALGSWTSGAGLELEWTDGNHWRSKSVELEPGSHVEFKVVKTAEDFAEWEGGPNRRAVIPENGDLATIVCIWDQPEATDIAVGASTADTAAPAGDPTATPTTSSSGDQEQSAGAADDDKVQTSAPKPKKTTRKKMKQAAQETHAAEALPASTAGAAAAEEQPSVEHLVPATAPPSEPAPAAAEDSEFRLPPELADCVRSMSVSAEDGTLTIAFNEDATDAATLVARLQRL